MNEPQPPTDEIEVEALEVVVNQQPIELYKVLKIGNLVNGGGEAKMAIAEGYVGVNGALEQRKRKKVYAGDIIEFNGQFLYVVCDQPVTEPIEHKTQSKMSNSAQPAAQSKKASASTGHKAEPQRNTKTGRRSIKF